MLCGEQGDSDERLHYRSQLPINRRDGPEGQHDRLRGEVSAAGRTRSAHGRRKGEMKVSVLTGVVSAGNAANGHAFKDAAKLSPCSEAEQEKLGRVRFAMV